VRRIGSDEFHDVEDHAEAAQTSAAGSHGFSSRGSCPRLTIKINTPLVDRHIPV
jgi:hypothetical protein